MGPKAFACTVSTIMYALSVVCAAVFCTVWGSVRIVGLLSRPKDTTLGQLPPWTPTWLPFLGHSLSLLLAPYDFVTSLE